MQMTMWCSLSPSMLQQCNSCPAAPCHLSAPTCLQPAADLCQQQSHRQKRSYWQASKRSFRLRPHAPLPLRCVCCAQVCSRILHHAHSGHAIAGSCCWSVAHNSYPDYDSFTVYLGPQQVHSATVEVAGTGIAAQHQRLFVRTEDRDQPVAHSSEQHEQQASSAAGSSPIPVEWHSQRQRHLDSETIACLRQHAADLAALSSAAEGHCRFM